MIRTGIDVGSKYIKAVALNGEDRTGYGLSLIHNDVGKAINEAVDQAYLSARKETFSKKRFCITGKGYKRKRKYMEKSNAQCLARYVHSLNQNEKLVIDAGNIFMDALIVSKKGIILESSRNDRCSAGCGRYIEIMSQALRIKINEIDTLFQKSEKPYAIASGCIVFAESEVITQVNAGESIPDILAGIVYLVAGKIATMYERNYSDNTGIIYLVGGIGKINAIRKAFEKLTKTPIQISEIDPQFASAYGAALFAE